MPKKAKEIGTGQKVELLRAQAAKARQMCIHIRTTFTQAEQELKEYTEQLKKAEKERFVIQKMHRNFYCNCFCNVLIST